MPRFHFPPSLFRRLSSKTSLKADSTASDGSETTAATSAPSPTLRGQQRPRKSSSLAKLRDKCRAPDDLADIPDVPQSRSTETSTSGITNTTTNHDAEQSSPPDLRVRVEDLPINPRVILEEPTPDAAEVLSRESQLQRSPHSHPHGVASGEVTLVSSLEDLQAAAAKDRPPHHLDLVHASSPSSSAHSLHLPTNDSTRRQSLASCTNARVIKALTEAPADPDRPRTNACVTATSKGLLPASPPPNKPKMSATIQRKIWVKRPGASATLVQIKEDDLVDDVRDMILRKYANSLGRTFDAPDMTLRIVTRTDHAGHSTERLLGPEEEMSRTIDAHYPGGQTVDEALIIDVPVKRTPKPSPRYYTSYHAMEDLRPQENGTDYFPPMPAVIQPTLPHTSGAPNIRDHMPADHPRSISVLSTGQVPPLPSPGGRRHRTEREHRPKYGRQHTSSPTIITHTSAPGPTGAAAPNPPPPHLHHRASNRPRVDSSASERHHPSGVPSAPPLPTPPALEAPPTGRTVPTPPTPSGAVPPSSRLVRPRKARKSTPDKPTSKARGPNTDVYGNVNGIPNGSSMLDGSVPPINVLIVEDNIINLRILEGLMKRLKVRWQTAMNGQIAVDKWKGGGYHLVLMDIQMPIMNGLQATKEIRRLERVNSIGVFSSSTPGSPNEANGDANGEANGTRSHNVDDDRLPKADGFFKSPVIIVALTASSLQSDRHEALAAGCNDFLTKPVNFVWLERKVKEWGCMQALIDFDGWRKWKDYAAKEEEGKSEEQKKKEREQEEKQRVKAEKLAKLQEKQRLKKEEDDRKKRETAEGTVKTATVPEDPHEEAAATNGS